MIMLFVLLALNFGVSWLNCWAVGGVWIESKALGGFPRVLAWCGAIQAAIGFSGVIGFVLGAIALQLGVLPKSAASGAAGLWYLLIIVPALGTGLIITIQSWLVAFRERSLANMGVAAYNTLAQAHNMAGAVRGVGDAFGAVSSLFSRDDDDDAVAMLAIVLVVMALAGGAVLAAVLIRRYAGRVPLPGGVA